MTITSSIKGQLTKARKQHAGADLFHAVRAIFTKHMPRQQAKHATKSYLALEG